MIKKLGKTETEISAIGVGTGSGYFIKDASKEGGYIEAIRKSINLGMTFIDTSEVYGAGYSEELIGKAVDKIRNKVFIATKVAPEHLRYEDVIRSAEDSLNRLQTDYIDLYQIHWPNPAIPLKETLSAMKYLLDEGKIKYVGVCNFTLKELIIAKKLANELGLDIVSNQVEYNLFDRSIEDDILPYCKKEKITIIAYSALDKGNINRYHQLKNIAEKYNKTVAQLILAWIVSHCNVIAIVKSENHNHIKENASVDFEIRKEDIEYINENFKTTCLEIPANKIVVNKEGLNNFTPSIPELAQSILSGITLKPIRVKHIRNGIYHIVEGKARYWAHVHAKGMKTGIRALVRD